MTIDISSVDQAVRIEAKKYNIPYANLRAVVQVESDGVFAARVNNRDEPLIRWEGHYFDRRLSAEQRVKARSLGLASPNAGGIANPRSQELRWNRLLLPAAKINHVAAYESCSWGLGQVMGSHWKALGFKSVDDMVNLARSGVHGQIQLMMDYCVVNNLIRYLKSGDFTAFARAYNGPGFRQNNYDGKMRDWARRYGAENNNLISNNNSSFVLRLGSSGAKVRELQTLLNRAGSRLVVDGDFGPLTLTAVKDFQKANNNLEPDGVVGPLTWAELDRFRVDNDQGIGKLTLAEAVIETKEGNEGAIAVIAGAGVTALTSVAPEPVRKVGAGFGALISFAGALWAWFGWRKANKEE